LTPVKTWQSISVHLSSSLDAPNGFDIKLKPSSEFQFRPQHFERSFRCDLRLHTEAFMNPIHRTDRPAHQKKVAIIPSLFWPLGNKDKDLFFFQICFSFARAILVF
jgi:hypothetical protein